MRSDELYLSDIIEAADAIEGFLDGIPRDDFMSNDLRRSAVLQKLIVIGEATAHISSDIRERYPEIEWRKIVGFRNFAVHAYFSVDFSIVWVAATKEAPALRDKIGHILQQEFGKQI